MYSVITWGTELLNQLGILQDRMSLFRIGSNNLLMIFSIYILKHSRFMKTFEHTAIFKSFGKSWMLRNINWKNHEKIVGSNSEQGHPIL